MTAKLTEDDTHGVLIVELGQEYNVFTIETLVKASDAQLFPKYNAIVVDGSHLEWIDSGGFEVFHLRQRFVEAGGNIFVFCGFNKENLSLFKEFAEIAEDPGFVHFPTRQEALEHAGLQK